MENRMIISVHIGIIRSNDTVESYDEEYSYPVTRDTNVIQHFKKEIREKAYEKHGIKNKDFAMFDFKVTY